MQEVVAWAVPFILGGIASGTITAAKMRRRKASAVEAGVQCLLRAEIIRSYKEYTRRGSCPIYAKEALKTMYAAYHGLGGNDVATELYSKILDLPEEVAAHEQI